MLQGLQTGWRIIINSNGWCFGEVFRRGWHQDGIYVDYQLLVMTQKQGVLTISLDGSHLGGGEDSGAGQVCPNRAAEDGHRTGDSSLLCSMENEKPIHEENLIVREKLGRTFGWPEVINDRKLNKNLWCSDRATRTSQIGWAGGRNFWSEW